MKELIPMNEYGLFADTKDTSRVDSRYVAEAFEKQHKNVIRDIEKITDADSGWSAEFNQLNFEPINFTDERGRKQKAYAMTRDGFTALAMGYTGKKAAQFKEAYIRRFNEMDAFIRSLITARQEFPQLTDHIKLVFDNPKPYHYINECDMINRIVLGMSAKKFREQHRIPKKESIRPYLTREQLEWIDRLQKVDIGLLISEPDFEKRKEYLRKYKSRLETARTDFKPKVAQISAEQDYPYSCV